jgi:hypothetical protein
MAGLVVLAVPVVLVVRRGARAVGPALLRAVSRGWAVPAARVVTAVGVARVARGRGRVAVVMPVLLVAPAALVVMVVSAGARARRVRVVMVGPVVLAVRVRLVLITVVMKALPEVLGALAVLVAPVVRRAARVVGRAPRPLV